ncbi:MAG: tryptophan--tRNA ligase, partial [Intestinibacter sp.]|uniref:tryptophan--tRNA ligase n=1 Tax=Intestinibacter sp. TaxID=1965304 RepID=UPI003F16F2C0
GSLKNRVALQNQDKYNMYIMIADQQALTDNAKNPKKIIDSLLEVTMDYISVGLDPAKTNLFIQSQIPELAELTVYYLNLVTVARLHRNPTVKSEIQQKGFGESIPAGFFVYPVSQVADITAFKADLVPVGNDQKPMIEQAREVVRSFNNIYGEVLVEPEGMYPEGIEGRLPGLDGKAKMSKSLGNAIYLSDEADVVQKKVMSMFTDPNHIRVEDPGCVENNAVFTYLDAFCKDKDTLEEMKAHYRRGGLGDVKVKRYLNDILQAELEPIRARRKELEKNKDYLYEVLRKGSDNARAVAAQTLSEVRDAMGIEYFKGMKF